MMIWPGLATKVAVHVVVLEQVTPLRIELPKLNTVAPGAVLKPVPVIVSVVVTGIVPVSTGMLFGVIAVIVGKTTKVNYGADGAPVIFSGSLSGGEYTWVKMKNR